MQNVEKELPGGAAAHSGRPAPARSLPQQLLLFIRAAATGHGTHGSHSPSRSLAEQGSWRLASPRGCCMTVMGKLPSDSRPCQLSFLESPPCSISSRAALAARV